MPDQIATTTRETSPIGLLTFAVGDVRCAMPLDGVVEVLRMVAVTPVPDMPPWHLGVVDLRGRITPVVDLRVRLGAPEAPIALTTPMVVVEDGGRCAAAVVDGVDAIRDGARLHEVAVPHGVGVADVEGGLAVVIDVPALVASAWTAAEAA